MAPSTMQIEESLQPVLTGIHCSCNTKIKIANLEASSLLLFCYERVMNHQKGITKCVKGQGIRVTYEMPIGLTKKVPLSLVGIEKNTMAPSLVKST